MENVKIIYTKDYKYIGENSKNNNYHEIKIAGNAALRCPVFNLKSRMDQLLKKK